MKREKGKQQTGRFTDRELEGRVEEWGWGVIANIKILKGRIEIYFYRRFLKTIHIIQVYAKLLNTGIQGNACLRHHRLPDNNSSARCGWPFIELLISGFQRSPQIHTAIVLGYHTELAGKTLLLRTPHSWVHSMRTWRNQACSVLEAFIFSG